MRQTQCQDYWTVSKLEFTRMKNIAATLSFDLYVMENIAHFNVFNKIPRNKESSEPKWISAVSYYLSNKSNFIYNICTAIACLIYCIRTLSTLYLQIIKILQHTEIVSFSYHQIFSLVYILSRRRQAISSFTICNINLRFCTRMFFERFLKLNYFKCTATPG